MSVGSPPLSATLVDAFRHLFSPEGAPDWAWPIAPSVPFVGRDYRPGAGLLIYASCENLGKFFGKTLPARFTDDRAFDRYRAAYAERPHPLPGGFPGVGIAPVSDGALMAAGLYVSQRLGLPAPEDPAALLEHLAISNVCKFTVHCHPNKDYPRDLPKVLCSLPYFVQELSVLRPAAVLLPGSYWRHPAVRLAMRGASPFTRFLPVYQCNARVVQGTLAGRDARARELEASARGTALARWLAQCRPRLGARWWRYVAFLEAVLAQHPAPPPVPAALAPAALATICAGE